MLRAPLTICLAILAGGVVAAPANNPEIINKAIVQRSFDAWTAGNGSPFDLLEEDAKWTIVGHSIVSGTYRNRAEFLREVIQPFNARMREGLRPQIRSIAADGNHVIILFDARAVARDGKPYTNTYAWFFDMRGGRIVNATAFFDSIAFNDMWKRVDP
jgi:hypothetical protein